MWDWEPVSDLGHIRMLDVEEHQLTVSHLKMVTHSLQNKSTVDRFLGGESLRRNRSLNHVEVDSLRSKVSPEQDCVRMDPFRH